MIYLLRVIGTEGNNSLFLNNKGTTTKFTTWAKQWKTQEEAEKAKEQMPDGKNFEVLGTEE